MNNEPINPIIVGYVRRSSHMQKDNFSIDAQKRAICEECQRRDLPLPVFYEDDEKSARSEQIAKRPAFKQLLADIEEDKVQVVFVHTLDRWSRNVMVTLQSFRILSEQQTAFISLSEHIDYSTPEGRLQLTILAAFAAYFSDMLAKHTSKGKGERAAQGLWNGDIAYGYRSTGPKSPPEPDSNEFPGLRLMGELRMQGKTAGSIMETVNIAGYRTNSKRFGARHFTIDTINAIFRNEFYAAYEPGDDRGTIVYQGKRYRGQHQAAFTWEEWQRIRAGSLSNYRAPHRAEQAKRTYEFSGYASCAYCGVNLRCKGGAKYAYYKDVAKARQLECPAGGFMQVRHTLVTQQFGELLQRLHVPRDWRERLQREALHLQETTLESIPEEVKQEQERLQQKRSRILKQHREGYIDDIEFEREMAAVLLSLRLLEAPAIAPMNQQDMLEAGEHLLAMGTSWDEASVEQRRTFLLSFLEPGGLHYDVENREIIAITPRPVFAPLLRYLEGAREYKEAPGTFVTFRERLRNRRDAVYRKLHQWDKVAEYFCITLHFVFMLCSSSTQNLDGHLVGLKFSRSSQSGEILARKN